MRTLRLLLPVLALLVSGAWATQAVACEAHKSAQAASAKAKAGGAKMSAACKAACAAKGATAAAHDHGAQAEGATATAAHSGSPQADAVTTSASSCASKATAVAAGAGARCGTKAKTSAVAAGAGDHCGFKGGKTTAKAAYGDCELCGDFALCLDDLEASGTRRQVVPLKNGVMFVYTAESAGRVSAVQTALVQRGERLSQVVTAGDKARLCPECKSMRGAMASGKLNREVVNIEGGALTLMTSSDPKLVARIHEMVEATKVAARTKS